MWVKATVDKRIKSHTYIIHTCTCKYHTPCTTYIHHTLYKPYTHVHVRKYILRSSILVHSCINSCINMCA